MGMSVYVSGLLKDALTVYFCQSVTQGWVGVCRGRHDGILLFLKASERSRPACRHFCNLLFFPRCKHEPLGSSHLHNIGSHPL